MLLFGSAGIPLSSKKRDSITGIKRIKELNLTAMELEFVRGVKMSKESARKVRKTAEENNIKLSVHAPYYINLNSIETKKVKASKKRILKSIEIAVEAGAKKLCFHPAYYGKSEKQACYDKVKKELKELLEAIEKNSWDIMLCPETTGKKTAFGSFEELLNLNKEFKSMGICIDFAHLHARSNGKINSLKEFKEILKQLKKEKPLLLKEFYAHVSGINYNEKGELNHLNLKESDFNYKDLMKALKEFNAKGIIICESPNLEKDALLLKQTYSNEI